MTVYLLHGFNVADAGKDTIGTLEPYLDFKDVIREDYGWVGLVRLVTVNRRTIRRLCEMLRPGDIIIGHSNGCWIANQIAHLYSHLGAVVCINPALRKDTTWPKELPVLCLHNKKDYVVQMGRLWAELFTFFNPDDMPHGWGAAGRWGFEQKSVINWDTNDESKWAVTSTGHSGVFKSAKFWGEHINDWLKKYARPLSVEE